MPTTMRQSPPIWFWIVSVPLLLWGAMGCFACIQQFRLGAEAMGPATDYDRALYASMPVWYNWVYALAVATALLARRGMARGLFAVSLVAVVVQFGYLFGATDLIAVKGVWTTYFRLLIAAVAAFSLWFAAHSIRRGWIS